MQLGTKCPTRLNTNARDTKNMQKGDKQNLPPPPAPGTLGTGELHGED